MGEQHTVKRLQQLCRIGEIAIDAAMVILVLGAALLALLMAACALLPASEADSSAFSSVAAAEAFLFTWLVACVLLVVFLWFLRRVFRSTARDGHPFTEGNAADLRRGALVALVAAIATPVIGYTAGILTAGTAVDGSLNLSPIVGAFVFYLLSLMFDYGAALQRESDETL